MSSDFLGVLQQITGFGLNGTVMPLNSTCKAAIGHYTFYQFAMIPAVLITIFFSFLEKRRSLMVSFLRGRPGCVLPMDALSRNSRISYACAFGVTSILLYRIVFEQKYAFKYEGPVYLTTLVAIVSVVIYGIAYYPVFACLTLGSVFAYGVGALYVWMFTVIEFYQIFECPVTLGARLLLIARNLPVLLCWLYLSLIIPVRLILAVKRKRTVESVEYELEKSQTLAGIRDSYQGLAVKKLLTRPQPLQPPPVGIINKIKSVIRNIVHDWLYHREKDFMYSARMLSVLFVCFLIIYTVSFELISFLYPSFRIVETYILSNIESSYGIYPTPGESQLVTVKRRTLNLYYYIVYAVKVCLIVSTVVALALGIVSLLHTLSSYRRNLRALYRGDHSHIPARSARSNANHMVGFLRYAGYQVGYVAWAYVIHFFLLFLLSLGLAIVISLIQLGFSDWLVRLIQNYWPVVLITLTLNLLQLLVSKFCFVQERGDVLAIENRRALYVFTYFIFFFNIFLGIVSCLLRILKSIIIGALFLGRLDHSTLTRSFQFFDPGFAAYVGFLHVENAHTHPVLIVFIRLMMLNITSEKGSVECLKLEDLKSDKEEAAQRRRNGARFNWQVAYTLLNNPIVRMYRKGYIQALNKALKEGKRRQVNDNLMEELHAFEPVKNNGDAISVDDKKSDYENR